ncbi:MmgE/PrpD family protein [Sphingopyxis kveilinensis]|uniref:MmgE/PrpD family protein n=1 Tax=Sphingopyxis kveilinensis TaxID=3114367 RepID=UPI0030D5AC05
MIGETTSDGAGSDTTAFLSRYVANFSFDTLDEAALRIAKHCLLDWFGVTLAARHEPIAALLVADADDAGGREQATLVGQGRRVSLRYAALINGAAAHVLDYDDVSFDMQGHPSAPVAPVAVALAEYLRLPGRALIECFAAGFEAACRVGVLMGSSHYRHGWHTTATFGVFGAAAAAARCLGLDEARTAQAFGIAGCHAAGLKSAFGTMAKSLQVGHAAADGLWAARLAERGVTAPTDIFDVAQGFAATQSISIDRDAARAEPPGGFYLRRNMFKYHSACYLTHSSIEAVRELHRKYPIDPAQIAAVEIVVDQDHLSVCNIEAPVTGLEMKFSLRAMVALALLKRDTAGEASFTAQSARDPMLVAMRDKIRVTARPSWGSSESDVILCMADGRMLSGRYDVGVPAIDLAHQETRLLAKFHSLASPVIGEGGAAELAGLCLDLEHVVDVSELARLAAAREVAHV